MKKILGIIGSPRKLGNCEIMVKEISRQISIPHELSLLRLQDFNILPCRGCYTCLLKNSQCVLDDDLHLFLKSIVEADALILSVPTYFLSANSCLKRLMDRGLALYAHVEKLWGKPAVGVGTAGIEGKEGYTLLCIESFLKLILADNKQSIIVYGALPGEVFINEHNKKTAADLASSLFGPSPERKEPCCPLCGGDTFRFLGNNKVRCMLCSNTGAINMQTNSPKFEINKSEHELFFSKENVLNHKKWLLNMKTRFAQQKHKLKKISISYLKEGNWIEP